MAWVAALASMLLAVAPSAATAAFPGRDGLFVVQPAGGGGLVLVDANGMHERQLCAISIPCDRAVDPVWSPDGSEILFQAPEPATPNPLGLTFQGPPSSGSGLRSFLAPFVVYADGSCLACAVPASSPTDSAYPAWGPTSHPGFLADGQLAVSFEADGFPPSRLGSVGVDGIGFHAFAVPGSWRQAAWSAGGRLAAVRVVRRRSEVFVIDPRSGAARQLTRGGADSPDWSPDGRRLAVVHRGWIEIIRARGGRMRRLARGDAPAWSPDGRRLAFVGGHRRLSVIAARGGAPRSVGRIRAAAVDWQPLTGPTPRSCQAPPGSTVVASTSEAVVTTRPVRTQGGDGLNPSSSFLGCLRSDGRERLLEGLQADGEDSATWVSQVALAGNYAAFVNDGLDPHYGGSGHSLTVFDLRTGATVPDRGLRETVGCADYGYTCSSSLDQLVLGPDAVTAAHTRVTDCESPPACTITEQIVADDSTGSLTLDTASTRGPYWAPPVLTGLTLSGDTLTWDHGGTPRSAQLH